MWGCNSHNRTEVPTWDLAACRRHWHPSQSSGRRRWCPRVLWSTAPHCYLQPAAQHLPKRGVGGGKKKLLFSDEGFRPASLGLELHLGFLTLLLLVLPLEWLVGRSAGRGTFPVPATAARKDGWCHVRFKAVAVPAGNLGSATAPGSSFCKMGVILHATLKSCMETAGSPIPMTLHWSIFHRSPHLREPLLLQLDVQQQQVNSLIPLRKGSAYVNALSIPTALHISCSVMCWEKGMLLSVVLQCRHAAQVCSLYPSL